MSGWNHAELSKGQGHDGRSAKGSSKGAGGPGGFARRPLPTRPPAPPSVRSRSEYDYHVLHNQGSTPSTYGSEWDHASQATWHKN